MTTFIGVVALYMVTIFVTAISAGNLYYKRFRDSHDLILLNEALVFVCTLGIMFLTLNASLSILILFTVLFAIVQGERELLFLSLKDYIIYSSYNKQMKR